MKWIVKIIEINPYTVTCLWNDSEIRMVNLSELIKKKSLTPGSSLSQLKNKKRFSEVKCDGTTLYWENGIIIKDSDGSEMPGSLDIDPEVLFEMSTPINEKVYQSS